MGAASPIEAVQTIGKYTLFEKVGEGYLGSVYRGFDQDLNRAVAVRVLCNGIKWDPKFEEHFRRQCQLLAELHHPGIAALYDVGQERQSHFLAMESLGGASLESLIAQKTAMTAEAKLAIMIQVADGLSYAHKKGILHRDLAPAKIHLTSDGKAKVRDFAIAHVLMKVLPHPAIRWGTPIYLSPEQVQQKECDPRSDLFSAGTIFYELFTHHHPFFDRDGNKALDNILLETQIPTFEQFPDEPPGIWPILKKCLEKHPNDRFQSLDELSSACRELQKDLVEDSRLMLAELYAALAPLRSVTAKRDAPRGSVVLLQDIQKLLRGETQPDCVALDKLMNVLLDHYPLIRAATAESSAKDPANTQLHMPGTEVVFVDKAGLFPLHPPAEMQGSSFMEHPHSAVGAQKSVAPSMQPQAPLADAKASDAKAGVSQGSSCASESTSIDNKEERPPVIQSTQESELTTGLKALRQKSQAEPPESKKSEAIPRYRKFRRPTYRTAAALLALLVIVAAAYIALGTNLARPVIDVWKSHILKSGILGKAFSFLRSNEGQNVMAASDNAGSGKSTESSQVIAPLPPIGEFESLDSEEVQTGPVHQPPQGSVNRISALISSGNLQAAKVELDKLQQSYPSAPRVFALRRQWMSKESAQIQERTLREQERLKAARKQREDEWSRQLTALFADGKYAEADSVLNLWLTENPGSWSAQEYGAKLAEIHRSLKLYSAAMAESRYQDAINALASAERNNPSDSNLANLRREVESRKASARAALTVYRLGPKAVLLLDGQPIGNDGEIENEIIPIGSHMLSIENGGIPILSKRQEFLENQRMTLVYDLSRQSLRTMVDSDRELLAQRRRMEEAHFFDVEHAHGAFRGNCRGILTVDYVDVAFKPSSGYHGFRIPFKLLTLSISGRSLDLINTTDNKQLQSFKLRDEQAAAKFKQSWDELKAFVR